MEKNCKHCDDLFKARRRNHVYCSTSCKTLASYKRNEYKYVPGHYMKNPDKEIDNNKLSVPAAMNDQIKTLEDSIIKLTENQNKTGLDVSSIKNTAAGTLVADASVYGIKKIFAPKTLPATKGDVEILENKIKELRDLISKLSTQSNYLGY